MDTGIGEEYSGPDKSEVSLFGEKFVKEIRQASIVVEVKPKIKKSERKSSFALTDEIFARRKREAWIEYHKALANGEEPEAIFWRIAWALRAMMMASQTNKVEDTPLHSYVFSRAKRGVGNMSPPDMARLSDKLISTWLSGRGRDLDLALERFLLTM